MDPFYIIGLVLGVMSVSVCLKVVGQSCYPPDLPPKYEILEAPPPYQV